MKEKNIQSWKLELKKFELELKEMKEAILLERSELANEKTMFSLEKENFDSKKNKASSMLKIEQNDKLMYQERIQDLLRNKRDLENR
jgi:hypothetical protein